MPEVGSGHTRDSRAAIVRHTHIQPGREGDYAHWRADLLAAIVKQPGLMRVEIHPPDPVQDDWVTIERFATAAQARAWLDSPVRAELAERTADFIRSPDTVTLLTDGAGADDGGTPEVTAVIRNRVLPGREAEFQRWLARIQQVQSVFPGYRGVSVQPPIDGVTDDWVSLLRFDSGENLCAWLESPQCAELTTEAEPLLDHAEYRVTSTSFSNWLPAEERAADPPVWKVNAIVLLVLYPVVLLTVVFLNPFLTPLGTALTVFIGNVIGVAATGFLLVPWAAGKLQRWLDPKPADEPRATRLGAVYMVLGYVGLIAAMTVIATRFG